MWCPGIQGAVVWRGLVPLCTWVFLHGGWNLCELRVEVRQIHVQWGSSTELQQEQQIGNMAGQRHPLEISDLFFKNSNCLYAKSLRI